MKLKCGKQDCSTIHTCYCTMAKASDGVFTCKRCVGEYEANKKKEQGNGQSNATPSPNNYQGPSPTLSNVSVNVKYANFHK